MSRKHWQWGFAPPKDHIWIPMVSLGSLRVNSVCAVEMGGDPWGTWQQHDDADGSSSQQTHPTTFHSTWTPRGLGEAQIVDTEDGKHNTGEGMSVAFAVQ